MTAENHFDHAPQYPQTTSSIALEPILITSPRSTIFLYHSSGKSLMHVSQATGSSFVPRFERTQGITSVQIKRKSSYTRTRTHTPC